MPVLGLGVAGLSEDETERAVSAALEIGCRLIDTAAAYGNEAAVGRAIAASGIPRAELFVTTKLATADQGFTISQSACNASLERLGLDYLDLYLIHWPAASVGKYVDCLRRDDPSPAETGRAARSASPTSPRSICRGHRPDLHHAGGQPDRAAPAAQPSRMRKADAQHNVVTQSYTPLALGSCWTTRR